MKSSDIVGVFVRQVMKQLASIEDAVFVMYVKPILSGWGSADIGEIHSVN
jgi:hypothetical protein